MTQGSREMHPFIKRLNDLRDTDDRKALAALRRGLGKEPGTAVEMFPYVFPWLPSDSNGFRWEENAYFLIASLFASHQAAGGQGNMGEVMAAIMQETGSASIEQRFVAFLNCHQDDFPNHLRHAVALAASKNIPIDWDRLFRDVLNWNNPKGWVKKEWAKSFWRQSDNESETEEEVNE